MRFETNWLDARVRTIRDLTPSVRRFEIEPEGGARLSYQPGAHVCVRTLIDGRPETRHYSLVGESDGSLLRIAVQLAPESRGGSAYMWSLKEGARLMISAPQNLFELDYGHDEYLLVAGGIGITPILGMAQALARRGTKVRLCYAGRSRDHMPFVDELSALLGDRLELFFSGEGRRLDLPAEIARLSPRGALYLCGPMRLLDAARHAWVGAGRALSDLRYETFGSSGALPTEPFWVKIPRLGVELTVPASKNLLGALAEAGVDVMSDCERGECGLCALDIVEVEGDVDHRDVFFSDHEKKENRRICACVSRVANGGVVLDTAYRPEQDRRG